MDNSVESFLITLRETPAKTCEKVSKNDHLLEIQFLKSRICCNTYVLPKHNLTNTLEQYLMHNFFDTLSSTAYSCKYSIDVAVEVCEELRSNP